MTDWRDDPDPADDWAPENPGTQPYDPDPYDPDPYGAADYDTGAFDLDSDADDWEEWRAPMSTGRKFVLAGIGTVAVLVVVLAVGLFWVQRKIDPPGPPGDPVEVEVAAGSTTEDIGSVLADAGVISNATVWNYWTRFNNEGPFQAGEYTFLANSSFDQAVAVLESGPRPPQSDRVTIPEGLTVDEIVARLGDPTTGIERWDPAAIQAAVDSDEVRSRYQPPDQPSMEGLLFPDTYEVGDEQDERTFVRSLVTEMDQRLAALDVEDRAAAFGLTPYQVIIIASLIEEEARVEGDRAKISRVIHNRLEQGIPLGIDATSRYEAELAGRDREDIDFSSDSPYNTRRVQGLPPTPIASPGQASLEAALAPADGPWIFYVLADTEGNHFFTESSREFERAKQECIRLDLGCG